MSKLVKDLYLDENIYNYSPGFGLKVEDSFVHVDTAQIMALSGNQNVGPQHLSSTLVVGQRNNVIGDHSAIFGADCKTGCYAIDIISANLSDCTITLSGDISNLQHGSIDDILDQYVSYSFAACYTQQSKVVSIDAQNNALSVDALASFAAHERFTLRDGELQQDPNGNIISGTTMIIWCPARPETGEYIHGPYQIAEGYGCVAATTGSHAEGRDTIAASFYSHAEGRATMAGYAAHAEGWQTSALGDESHASGFKAVAKHNCSYVWNTSTTNNYYSHGNGTFNIFPAQNDIRNMNDAKLHPEKYVWLAEQSLENVIARVSNGSADVIGELSSQVHIDAKKIKAVEDSITLSSTKEYEQIDISQYDKVESKYLSYDNGQPQAAGAQDCAYIMLPVEYCQTIKIQTYLGQHTAICQYKNADTSSYIEGTSIYYINERQPTLRNEEFTVQPNCKYVGISTFKKSEPIVAYNVIENKTYGSMVYVYDKLNEIEQDMQQLNEIADEILS